MDRTQRSGRYAFEQEEDRELGFAKLSKPTWLAAKKLWEALRRCQGRFPEEDSPSLGVLCQAQEELYGAFKYLERISKIFISTLNFQSFNIPKFLV